MIEILIRGIGWVLLKAVTGGRYSSAGSSAELFEGTVGLLVLAGITWVGYRWLT
jgi:hypothetical protein